MYYPKAQGFIYKKTRRVSRGERGDIPITSPGGMFYLRKRDQMMRRNPRRKRGRALIACTAVSRTNPSIASTKRFRLRTGGTYSDSGAAENATAINSCSISPFLSNRWFPSSCVELASPVLQLSRGLTTR